MSDLQPYKLSQWSGTNAGSGNVATVSPSVAIEAVRNKGADNSAAASALPMDCRTEAECLHNDKTAGRDVLRAIVRPHGGAAGSREIGFPITPAVHGNARVGVENPQQPVGTRLKK